MSRKVQVILCFMLKQRSPFPVTGRLSPANLTAAAALQALLTGNRFQGNEVRSFKQSVLLRTVSCFSSTMSVQSQKNLSVTMSNDLQSTSTDINGQISQIPGLSPISSVAEEKVRGRRAGVRESDSDYIKLAKQGGHKGLLWHEATLNSKCDSYKPLDSFLTASEGDGFPSIINSEEMKNPRAFHSAEPPFETDNMSAWERDDSSSYGKEKNNNVHYNQMEKLQAPSHYHERSKFKRIMYDKNPAPVDMSKLLSFGYAEDKKPAANTDLSD